MIRCSDWPSRLSDFVQAGRKRPFEWGRFDCIGFACGAVEAMTGENPRRAFTRRYTTERGAARALRREPLLEVVRRLAEAQGAVAVEPFYARRGDMCVLPGPRRLDAVGICVGAHAAVLTPEGLRFVPVEKSLGVWRF